MVGRIRNPVLSPFVSLHHADVEDPETISVFVTMGSKSRSANSYLFSKYMTCYTMSFSFLAVLKKYIFLSIFQMSC